MLEWKRDKDGTTALLIKGARRIGKSTIAEEFARNEYESYIKIDFADAPRELWEAIENISDRDDFFMRIQFIYGVSLVPRKSVIIFDEIQKCPLARQAIKYLVKDHRYDYIETGSLLSIRKNTKGIVIPSEETRLTMHPMDYEEFQWAVGKNDMSEILAEVLKKRKAIGDATVRKLMRDFRLYMLIGGMPQAVAVYLDTLNLQQVDQTKREIIDLYLDDFEKIDSTGRIQMIFKSIPAQLSGNSLGFQGRKVVKNVRDKERLTELIRELEDSLTVNICHHANDPNVGMALHADYDTFKIYLADTGLFVTLAFWDKEFSDNEIYGKLLSDKLPVDLGYVYENMISQILVAAGHKLFYYSWPTDSGRHNYEIDFLLTNGKKIDPIEVKSSGYKTHASLDAFMDKFSERVGEGYLIYTKDLRREGNIMCMPGFMAVPLAKRR